MLGNIQENYEITQTLKHGDIFFEYNGMRINNKATFIKTQKECTQEIVNIKLIRDNKPMSFLLPAFQIYGLEDYFYEDKDGLLNKNLVRC